MGCTNDEIHTCTFVPVKPTASGSKLAHSDRFDESKNHNVGAIVVQDNYAYLGVGKTLIILDVTDASNPSEVGEILLPTLIDWLFLVDDYVFVTEYGLPRKTSIVNVSNPLSPVLMECEEGISLILARTSLIENYTFAPLQDDGSLSVYEIIHEAEKTRLVEVSSYQSSTPPTVHLIPNLEIVGSMTRTVTDVAIVGQHAYVAESLWGGSSYYDGRVRIFDVSDPTTFEPVADYILPNNGGAFSLLASSNYIVVADNYQEGGYAAIILDITNPKMPQEVGVVTGLEAPIYVDDKFAYFIHVTDGLATVRVRDLANPRKIVQSDWETSNYGWVLGWSGDMTIVDNHAYLLDSGLLHIIDVTDPFAPRELTVINVDSGQDK